MRIVVQRVIESSVTIDGAVHGSIGKGMMLLVAFEDGDCSQDIEWMCSKIINLRIFDDSDGVMNISIKEIDGDILVISQFTLFASTKKGNRPSYIRAARPETAIPLYQEFIRTLENNLGKKVSCGIFGADMKVSLVNDGPVTIIIDSKNKE